MSIFVRIETMWFEEPHKPFSDAWHRYLLVAGQPNISTLTPEEICTAKLGSAALAISSAWNCLLTSPPPSPCRTNLKRHLIQKSIPGIYWSSSWDQDFQPRGMLIHFLLILSKDVSIFLQIFGSILHRFQVALPPKMPTPNIWSELSCFLILSFSGVSICSTSHHTTHVLTATVLPSWRMTPLFLQAVRGRD